jgi:hypothetical protein
MIIFPWLRMVSYDVMYLDSVCDVAQNVVMEISRLNRR